MFPTPDFMRRLPFWSMNAKTGSICPMTEWLAFWRRTKTGKPLAIAHDLDHKIEKLINDAAVEQSFC